MRVLIVAADPPERQNLRDCLKRFHDVSIVGECDNGRDAIEAIGRRTPDLVFLDVQLPDATGFDVVRDVDPERMPQVIFVSAVNDYAMRAFEVQALDYLLQPLDDRRLETSLRHARAALTRKREGMLGRHLAAAMKHLDHAGAAVIPKWSFDRVAIPTGDRIAVVRVAEIDWVEASGNYVSLHLDKRTRLLRETIGTMEQRLGAHGFVRIHRSTLVNFERILELRTLDSGEYVVVLRDGTSLKVSRNYRPTLTKLLHGIFDRDQ